MYIIDLVKKQIKKINTVPIITHNNEYVGDYMALAKLLQPTFDYEHLHKITKMVTENLDKVIDINYYPTEKTRRSNLRHRPIGIGVQGLADTFALMNIPFHSKEAQEINKKNIRNDVSRFIREEQRNCTRTSYGNDIAPKNL